MPARGARRVRPEGTQGRASWARSARAARATKAGVLARRRHPRGQRQAGRRAATSSCRRSSALKPGTTVPIKVLREKQEKTLNVTIGELDLEAEGNQQSAAEPKSEEDASEGFGITLGNLTADRARGWVCRPARPARSSPTSIRTAARRAPAAARRRHPGGQPRSDVESAAAAQRELQKVRVGRDGIPAGLAAEPGSLRHHPQGRRAAVRRHR